MVFLFNFNMCFGVVLFKFPITNPSYRGLIEFWFGLILGFFLRNRNLNLYQNKIYMITNSNVPTNCLSSKSL